MKAIGVRELKARLSQYLRDVQAGEVVLVTDRGRVIAELRPAPDATLSEESALERGLRRMAERGALVVREPHDPGVYGPSPLGPRPAGTAQAWLDAERGER